MPRSDDTPNRRERVHAYLVACAGTWVDARDLARIGGFAGWRTRVSEARQVARQDGADIVNRCFDRDGYRVSQYRYVVS